MGSNVSRRWLIGEKKIIMEYVENTCFSVNQKESKYSPFDTTRLLLALRLVTVYVVSF